MGSKRKKLIITIVPLIIIVAAIFYHVPITRIPFPEHLTKLDKFGIVEIYPTKPGGREWLIDNGGWNANEPDLLFFSANCGKAKDHILTSGGPLAIFRSDNMTWNFRDLSVREIQPPPS